MSDLNPVRGPYKRLVAHFKPVDPNTPPGKPGPLIHVRRPLVRLKLQFEPVTPALHLSVAADADPVAVLPRAVEVLGDLDRYARASGGAGLSADTAHSTATIGRVVLRVVPADPARGPEQAEILRLQLRQLPGVIDVTVSTAA